MLCCLWWTLLVFTLSAAISRWRRCVLRLSVRQWVIKILSTISSRPRVGISSRLQYELLLGTEINWLDFEVKRSKVNVTTRPNMVKNRLLKMQLSSEGIPSTASTTYSLFFLNWTLIITYFRQSYTCLCQKTCTLRSSLVLNSAFIPISTS